MSTDYRFGRFELRIAARQLLADGVPLRVGGRALALLGVLVERHGHTVARAELFERVWPGRVVEDDNLKVQVMALRKLLGAQAISTVAGQGYGFALPVQRVDAAPAAPPGLPLFGREADVATLCALLATQRLVTLTGPGGIGKTRAAQAVAERLRPQFADGVAWVELAPVAEPQALPHTLARALGLSASAAQASADGLAHALRALSLLVVLDNCEHLLEAVAPLVAALLQHAPGVRVLATSQEPLRVAGEQVQRLPTLRWPDEGEADVAAALQFGAVALFVARAQAAQPGFALDAQNLDAVLGLCHRLDGLPLALELAAARVPLLGVHGVCARLDEPLRLLARSARGAPGAAQRHQALRHALEWSVGLLSEAEQRVLRRLGVFVGSFALDAAQAVAGDDADDGWSVLDILGALIDKSLVQALPADDDTSAPRYRLLDSTRAFALERLAAAGETDDMRRRHARALCRLFEQAETAYFGTPVLQWVGRVMPDLDNLREAMAWTLGPQGDTLLAIELAGNAGRFWAAGGLDGEAARWIDAVRPWVTDDTPPRLAAPFWAALAMRSVNLTVRPRDAFDAAARALGLFRALGDRHGVYRTLNFYLQLGQRIGVVTDPQPLIDEMRACEEPHWTVLQCHQRRWAEARQPARLGQWAASRAALHDELRLLADAGDEWRAWLAAHNVALADITLGRPHDAIAVMEPAVAQIRRRGLLRRCWPQVAMLAMAHIEAGDAVQAAPRVREALLQMQVEGAAWWLADHLAWWMAQAGHLDRAAALHGWAEQRLADRGEPRSEQGRAARDRLRGQLQAAFDDDGLARAIAQGAAWSDDEAVQRVLQACADMAPLC